MRVWLVENKVDFLVVLGLLMAIGTGAMFYALKTQIRGVETALVCGERTEKLLNCGTMLVTKYNKNETKETAKGIMANGEKVYVGACAISPDLRDSGILMIGDIVFIADYGYFIVSDYTNERHKRVIDIYTHSVAEAKKHGAKRKRVFLVMLEE